MNKDLKGDCENHSRDHIDNYSFFSYRGFDKRECQGLSS